MRRSSALLAVVAAAALALGSGAVALAGAPTGPLEGDWQLIQARDAVGDFAVEHAAITLEVRGQSASGYAACGDYALRLTGEPARVAFQEPAGSEQAASEQCSPQLEQLRVLFLDALTATDSATVEGETLRLRGDDTHLVFIAIPRFPEAQLDGTSWVLESYGESWSRQRFSPQAGASTLRFSGDDRFTATLACGKTIGLYRVSRTEATAVTFDVVGPGSAVGSAFCPRAAAIQDIRVTELLRGFRASLHGERLVLTRNRLEAVFRPADAEPADD
jgi:heat shock protein HslJ